MDADSSDWQVVSLADVCDLVPGFAFKSKDFGDYPDKVIKIKDIQPPFVNSMDLEGVDLSKYNKSKIEKYIVYPGDYVLAMTGATIGKIGVITKGSFYINQRVLVFRPKQDLCDKRFLYYTLLNSDFLPFVLNHIDSESAQPNISATTIGKYEFALPPIPIQQEIARVLSSLDDKIEVNNQINRNLEEQAKAIFKSWFVDFEPFKNGKFIDSELGRIPKGWETGKFTDVVQILGGGTPKTSIPEYWNGMIPFFTPKDVGDSIYTFATEKNLTEEGLNNCNSRLYPENTVFVTARGTVGKLALAGVPMAMNQSCYALVGKNVSPLFVFFLALQVVETLKKIANGAVFDAIVTRDFETKSVIIPPEEAINRFVELIAPIFKMIHSNVIQNTSLVQSRDTLLPKLMSGEFDINIKKENTR